MKKNAIVVLSAGRGKRMKNPDPKMLLEICGKPILYWTLKNLNSSPTIDGIVTVIPLEQSSLFKKKIGSWKFKKVMAIVEGGEERVDSARKGFSQIPSEFDLIGIHDGARPFVSHSELQKLFLEASEFGAAILAVPSPDTIKEVKDGFIQGTIPRDRCWSAQTPQVFQRKILEKMVQFPLAGVKNRCTDDAYLAESLKVPVKIVCGSYKNIKITTPQDLILARHFLKDNK